jgi:O-antigen/teichoic acid export membrane protein
MILNTAPSAQSGRLAALYTQGRRLLSSSLIRRSFVYTASVSLSALTNFLLLPVLTRYLSPADYGIIETFLSLSALLTAIVILGANTSLSKDYFKLQEQERGLYLGNALCLIGAAGLFTGLVIVIQPITVLLGQWLHVPVIVVLLAAVAAIAKAVMSMTQVLFQLQKRVAAFAVFTNSTTLGELALSVFLIVGLGLQWRGRVTGIAISYTIAALVALVWLRRTGVAQMRPLKFSGAILRSSVPLVVAQLAGWTQMMVDRLIISHLVNPSATGLYAVGSRFAMVVLMIETAFSLAWLPFIYESLNQKTPAADRKIVQATYLYSLFLIGFSLVFGLSSQFLLYAMVPKQYFGAGAYIFLLSMGYCADGIWKLFLGYLLHDNRSSAYSVILCASALLDIGLGYALVTHFGPIGAAWATFLSFLFGMIATIVVAVRTHKMPWLEVLGRRKTLDLAA